MEKIWELILTNLTNVGIGIAIFLCAYLANMCLGIYSNIAIFGQTFDWRRIAESAIKILCIGVGIILLVTSITLIVPFASANGLTIPQEYGDVVNIVATLGLCLVAALKYIKEAYGKLQIVLKGEVKE